MEPRTAIYKNKATGTYYVQSYTIGPVAATWFGDPAVIRPEEFTAKIASEVIKSLERFGKEKFDPAKARRFTPKQQREFLDQNIEINVSKPSSGGLVIHPLRREERGRVGDKEGTIFLSEEELPNGLPSAIARAFQRAT